MTQEVPPAVNAVLTQPAPAVFTAPAPAEPDVQDFSIQYTPLKFRINGPEVYEAHPVLPVPVLRNITKLHQAMDQQPADEKFNLLLQMLDLLLKPTDAERFRQRVESLEEPVDLQRQLMPILQWLMERYGMRPTPAAGSSQPGPSSNGTGSTAGAPPATSTPSGSQPTGS